MGTNDGDDYTIDPVYVLRDFHSRVGNDSSMSFFDGDFTVCNGYCSAN